MGRLWRYLTGWANAPHDPLTAAQRLLELLELHPH